MSLGRKYSEFPYERPDLATIEAEACRLLAAWDGATDAAAQAELVRQWDGSRKGLNTLRSLAFLRFEQDTRDPEAREEKEFFDDLSPRVTELTLAFLRRVVDSPRRSELEKSFGRHAFRLWEGALSSFDPSIADDRRRESQLGNEYTGLVAA